MRTMMQYSVVSALRSPTIPQVKGLKKCQSQNRPYLLIHRPHPGIMSFFWTTRLNLACDDRCLVSDGQLTGMGHRPWVG